MHVFTSLRGLLLCLAAFAAVSPAEAADLWVSAADPAVVTNNDCGFVAAAHGGVRIRRSFLPENDPGVPAQNADRVNSGDFLLSPNGGRMEVVCGDNAVFVIGSGASVRLGGLRSFTDAAGRTATRLDVDILSGEIRIQVRKNEEKPEYVLASVDGADLLVSRGDAVLSAGNVWMLSALSGAAEARGRRGRVTGAPFEIAAGHAVGEDGEVRMTEETVSALRRRLPFSFELTVLALPPEPAAGEDVEAP